ncbi:MAG TPA: DUF2202 domain-containing protein [Flavobacteriia bacterium]|nr:DUF2202 domain-containing protein [Flavobacteriia bacterium]
MKKLAVITMAVILSVVSSCSDDDDTTQIAQTATLSQQEKDDLLFLREEEKLARDVYLFSFDKYGEAIFNNISQSEQQHMDQVLTLLNAYQLSDPASADRGVFVNQELQTLYNNLTAQSDISLVEALKVGATIEDLDIRDIEDFESRTTKTDILSVYDKLRCGSRNHLRSYVGQLVANEVTYVQQFITLEEFTEIINSANERCGQ